MIGRRWVSLGCGVLLLLTIVGCGQAATTTTTSTSRLATTTTAVSAEEAFIRDFIPDLVTFMNLFKDNGTATDLTVEREYAIIHQLWTKWQDRTGLCEKSNELVALWQKTLEAFDTCWEAYAAGDTRRGNAALADLGDIHALGVRWPNCSMRWQYLWG